MSADAIKTGGPAFPCEDIIQCDEKGRLHGQEISSVGLSIRDYFAAKALQGCRAYFNDSRGDFHTNSQPDETAKYCYALADAMLFARDAS